MRFEITEAELAKLKPWLEEQDKLVLAKQEAEKNQHIVGGRPYYGAIGGEIIYSFTPTSLGIVCVVHHAGTKNEINLTDYGSW